MSKFKKIYRYPKTTQEKRADTKESREFIRGKRHSSHLPSSYDDVYVKHGKSWKDRRKQKYHIDKVKKYTIKVICPSGIFDTSHWHRFHKVEVLIEQLGYRITKSNWRDNTITYYGKYIRFKQDYVKYINRK